MKETLAIFLVGLATIACGALQGGTPNNPFVPAPESVPFVYDGHVRQFSFWQDHSPETIAFTTAMTLNVDCDDPAAVQKTLEILAHDPRPVIWFAPMFAYGAEGYELRENAAWCWQHEADLIRNNRERSLMVWGPDEPPDVAWSFWVNGGTRYDPNRYNGIITAAAAMVAADFPGLGFGYNFGSLPIGSQLAAGTTLVGVEAYGADWLDKLRRLETLTPLNIWLLAPAFAQGDPSALDPILAQRVRDEWAWSQHDSRITGWYPFLWCCDDTTTGTRDFYTISGGHLPLTFAAIQAVSRGVLYGTTGQ